VTLEKLTITPLSLPELQPSRDLPPIAVLFNPTSYSISKSVTWKSPEPTSELSTKKLAATQRKLNAPILVFGGGGSRVLTLELFFDVTEPIERKGSTIAIADVREETNKVVNLTHIQRVKGKEKPPPICEVAWGRQTPTGSDFPFVGVITSLTQNFTLFKSDGRPVRANLSVQFTEFLDPKRDKRKTDPELTTHIVQRGDTLSSIAAEIYRDPTRWRVIAEANRLSDPLRLNVGQALIVPKLL
jgi:nucleoid-associated protein YgaU